MTRQSVGDTQASKQSAGNTQPPLKQSKDGGESGPRGETPNIGMQLTGPMTVQANNVDQFKYQMAQTQQQYNLGRSQYPSPRP